LAPVELKGVGALNAIGGKADEDELCFFSTFGFSFEKQDGVGALLAIGGKADDSLDLVPGALKGVGAFNAIGGKPEETGVSFFSVEATGKLNGVGGLVVIDDKAGVFFSLSAPTALNGVGAFDAIGGKAEQLKLFFLSAGFSLEKLKGVGALLAMGGKAEFTGAKELCEVVLLLAPTAQNGVGAFDAIGGKAKKDELFFFSAGFSLEKRKGVGALVAMGGKADVELAGTEALCEVVLILASTAPNDVGAFDAIGGKAEDDGPCFFSAGFVKEKLTGVGALVAMGGKADVELAGANGLCAVVLVFTPKALNGVGAFDAIGGKSEEDELSFFSAAGFSLNELNGVGGLLAMGGKLKAEDGAVPVDTHPKGVGALLDIGGKADTGPVVSFFGV
jgi:hypothetical protein